MVYDWENKEEICYQMYIEEKKSLEDIMEFMKKEHNFAPSKRAFQTQFKRWDFPSKQHPAHKNAALVQRVKELWDCNTSQKAMLSTLNEEGHDIKERELMRVRAKNRWLLRVPNGMKKKSSDQEVIDQLQAALYPDPQTQNARAEDAAMDAMDIQMPGRSVRPSSPPLSPEVMQKRQERLAKLQAESSDRYAARKRRRRTRGWAGLPADPPGPPRFPSETTIDESKTFLSLDSKLYKELRESFQRICEEENIIKKTIAGPERWEAAKDRLIQESLHLQGVFWSSDENIEQKKLSLDVVCSDVTKRMRTLERRMTIAEAKNALGVNPEQSRQLRGSFYQTLKEDHFTSKLEAGEEHWKELKAQWISKSTLLQSILAPGDADPQHQLKVKATEVLCRDVMKRLRDDQTKRDPTRKKKMDPNTEFRAPEPQMQMQQPLPQDMPRFEPVPENSYQQHSHQSLVQTATRAQEQSEAVQEQAHHAQNQNHLPPQQPHPQVMMEHDNMQIDPNLLIAAVNGQDMGMGQGIQYTQFGQRPSSAEDFRHLSFQGNPIAIYFRLHDESHYQLPSRVWVGTLSMVSIQELRDSAASKFPGSITYRVEGVLKDESGNDMTIPIDQDEELEAYFAAVNHTKPTFQVTLISTHQY